MVPDAAVGTGGRSASSAQSRRRWLFLFRPKWLGWHAFAVFAAIGMLWLGDWQFHRAEAGNGLSWAYAFEWPLFALLGAAFWTKTILEELRSPSAARHDADELDLLPGTGSLAGTQPGVPAESERNDARNDAETTAYVARLRAEIRGHGRWHGLR